MGYTLDLPKTGRQEGEGAESRQQGGGGEEKAGEASSDTVWWAPTSRFQNNGELGRAVRCCPPEVLLGGPQGGPDLAGP